MTACFCGRQPRGFAWHDFAVNPFDRKPPVLCCSLPCLDIAAQRKGNMDLTIDEKRAVAAASGKVGEYLERIGKSDLATMTEAEWLGFIAHAYACTCDEVRAIWHAEAPL